MFDWGLVSLCSGRRNSVAPQSRVDEEGSGVGKGGLGDRGGGRQRSTEDV